MAQRDSKRATCQDGSLERATGIEPVWLAWKASALPLCDARNDDILPRRHPLVKAEDECQPKTARIVLVV